MHLGMESYLSNVNSIFSTPDCESFNTMLNTCASCGDVTHADFLFESMLQHGVRPNKTTYDHMIGACAKIGKIKGVKKWLYKMIANGNQADHNTFNILLRAGHVAGLLNVPFWAYKCIIKACTYQDPVW